MKSLLPILTLIFGLAFMVGCSADQVVGPDTGSADLERMSRTVDCATAVTDQEPQITEDTANGPRDSTAVGTNKTPNEQDTWSAPLILDNYPGWL